MKKLFLSTICIGSLIIVFVFKGITVNAAIAPPFDPGDMDPSYINDIEIKSNNLTYSMKSFDIKKHVRYGSIKSINKEFESEDKPIYDSYWTTQPTTYKNVDTAQFDTYYFEKYIDLPIEVLHSRKVSAGDFMTFTVQTTSSHTESSIITSSRATNFYWEYSHSSNFSMGVAMPINLINLKAGITASNSIKVGGSVSSSISSTTSSITSYSTVYTETFVFDNQTSNHDTYFDMNYRQKFRVYFTTRYNYNYDTRTWGTGAFNKDKHWEYTLKNYVPVGTYVYLIPVENPYFELSKYYDNSLGLKEIIKNNPNSNIIYL